MAMRFGHHAIGRLDDWVISPSVVPALQRFLRFQLSASSPPDSGLLRSCLLSSVPSPLPVRSPRCAQGRPPATLAPLKPCPGETQADARPDRDSTAVARPSAPGARTTAARLVPSASGRAPSLFAPLSGRGQSVFPPLPRERAGVRAERLRRPPRRLVAPSRHETNPRRARPRPIQSADHRRTPQRLGPGHQAARVGPHVRR